MNYIYVMIFLVVLLIVFVILWFFERIKRKKEVLNFQNQINYLKQENNFLKSALDDKKEEIENTNKKYDDLMQEYMILNADFSALSSKYQEKENYYKKLIENIENSKEKLKNEFEVLANEIFNKYSISNEISISKILEPISKQVKEFEEKIIYLKEKDIELMNELKNLKELNYKLSKEAENLTKALKGDKKTQGIWGELILERVLEMSGLRKDKEYFREKTLYFKGETYRPDVIVKLPNQRYVIIDAKTSLNAYSEYIKTEKEEYIKAHIKAIKNHIDKLASKNYENLDGINTLDFIFMFIPIENALNIALEYDSTLYEYAFKKRVILTTPSTLLVSLRSIEALWRFERQNENIKEVIKLADTIYNKARLFLEDFEKVEKSIENTKKNYLNAKNRLINDRGNLIELLENLKEKAGIKPKKELK